MLTSYCRVDVEIHADDHNFHAERGCELVAKIEIAKFFLAVFFGDSRKFMLMKIFRYMICAHSSRIYMYVYINWFRRKVSMYTFSVLNLVYDSFLRDLHF